MKRGQIKLATNIQEGTMIRYRKFWLSTSYSIITITALQSQAADIQIIQRNYDEGVIVYINGEILYQDDEIFTKKLNSLLPGTKVLVSLNSIGGSAIAGINIGIEIRNQNLNTTVIDGNKCASACAMVWLGGAKRYAGTNAKIGFHAIYNENGQEVGAANALAGWYLTKLGLSSEAIVYVTSASPTSMSWLTWQDAKKFGIEITPIGLPTQQAITPTQQSLEAAAKLYIDNWAKDKPYFQQVRDEMKRLIESGEVPLLSNGMPDLDTAYNKAIEPILYAKYPWIAPSTARLRYNVTTDLHLRTSPDPRSADVLGPAPADYIPKGSVISAYAGVSCRWSDTGSRDVWCPVLYILSTSSYKGWVNAYFLTTQDGRRVSCAIDATARGCAQQPTIE